MSVLRAQAAASRPDDGFVQRRGKARESGRSGRRKPEAFVGNENPTRRRGPARRGPSVALYRASRPSNVESPTWRSGVGPVQRTGATRASSPASGRSFRGTGTACRLRQARWRIRRSVASHVYRRRVTEAAGLVLRIERTPHSTIRRARGSVRHELPDLHREFQRGRGRLPPSLKATVAWRLVEGALNLHDIEARRVRLHRYREAAKADTNVRTGHGAELTPSMREAVGTWRRPGGANRGRRGRHIKLATRCRHSYRSAPALRGERRSPYDCHHMNHMKDRRDAP
jgi:hypothetical protein